jgi:hypothetical protein
MAKEGREEGRPTCVEPCVGGYLPDHRDLLRSAGAVAFARNRRVRTERWGTVTSRGSTYPIPPHDPIPEPVPRPHIPDDLGEPLVAWAAVLPLHPDLKHLDLARIQCGVQQLMTPGEPLAQLTEPREGEAHRDRMNHIQGKRARRWRRRPYPQPGPPGL